MPVVQQAGGAVYIAGNGNNTTGTAGTLNDVVWSNWQYVGTTTTAIMFQPTWESWNNTYQETREQCAERQRREREIREDAEALLRSQRQEYDKARERALELLGTVLTVEQMASYREKGWFEVRGSKGRRWRIRANGVAGNVDLMPEIGQVREATYCAHPPQALPAPDVHLAQMLALVTDEDEFVRVANVRYRRAA